MEISLKNRDLEERIELDSILNEIITNKRVQEMKKIPQHYNTNCFDHCYQVSYYCYKICKKLNLDYVSSARAGMLHDMFLYNWRERQNDRKGLHAFTHGKVAYENASKEFNLNEKEKDMIIKHMWPLTLAVPKSREGMILTFVDKFCALSESLSYISSKKLIRYAYLAMCVFFIKL